MRLTRALPLIAAVLFPAWLPAHAGPTELRKPDLWTAWEFAPSIVLPLLLAAALYTRGTRRAADSGPRRAAFWAGWTALALALVSPLHALGEWLFAAHMLQHEILMVVAAPLLVAARPGVALLWGLPLRLRRWTGRVARTALWRKLATPFTAWWLHALVLWGWHIPALFESTLTSELAHAAQHTTFLGSALLFWWAVLEGREGRMSYGASLLYVFTTAVHTSILGAALTFSQVLWYPAYAPRTSPWGFLPIEDQQLGGLIMWVPAGITYLVIGLVLCARWLRGSPGRVGPEADPYALP
jgi:putative membrane protein